LTCVGTRNFSFCSPSRGETSTILTDDIARNRRTDGNAERNRKEAEEEEDEERRGREESVEVEEEEEEA